MNKPPPIKIPSKLWLKTWSGLRRRGKNKRESICVWAGKRHETSLEVAEVFFLDDFPGVEGFALFHRISREAVAQLFQKLRAEGLELIADVHTHPENWVGLSPIDKEHPLEYRIGFISIVIPHYAAVSAAVNIIGVHEYLGSSEWHDLTPGEVVDRVRIGSGS